MKNIGLKLKEFAINALIVLLLGVALLIVIACVVTLLVLVLAPMILAMVFNEAWILLYVPLTVVTWFVGKRIIKIMNKDPFEEEEMYEY